jgi:hypothetical protein
MTAEVLMRRALLLLSFGALVACFAASPQPTNGQDNGWTPLFNGKDLTGWKVFLDPKKRDQVKDPEQIFTVKDGILAVRGDINGYVRTEKEYGDYTLKLQWRWGEKTYTKAGNRNSGVFVHVTGEDKIWPKGVEAQLAAGRAGDFWLVDNFKLSVDQSRQDPKVSRHYFHLKDDVEKPAGEWNQYEITCDGGKIKLVVNGVFQNEGAHAEVMRGNIILQSEGAEIYFRDIKMKQK